MDTTNRKGMEKLYLKRLFILLFLFPASLWAQDALSETPVRSTDTEAINEIVTGLNTVWMLLAAMLVFFMQPGFALVEAGFIRTKNTANVLMKNLIDFYVRFHPLLVHRFRIDVRCGRFRRHATFFQP